MHTVSMLECTAAFKKLWSLIGSSLNCLVLLTLHPLHPQPLPHNPEGLSSQWSPHELPSHDRIYTHRTFE